MIKKLISKFLDVTFLKFILVGVANTAFGSAIMFGLYNLAGCSYWFSSAMNYICGSVLSYFLNKAFTFRDKSKDFATVLRFAANIAVCYLIAYGAARPLIRLLLSSAGEKLQENVAMLAGMCIFVALNYLGQRILVFRIDRKPDVGDKAQDNGDSSDNS